MATYTTRVIGHSFEKAPQMCDDTYLSMVLRLRLLQQRAVPADERSVQ